MTLDRLRTSGGLGRAVTRVARDASGVSSAADRDLARTLLRNWGGLLLGGGRRAGSAARGSSGSRSRARSGSSRGQQGRPTPSTALYAYRPSGPPSVDLSRSSSGRDRKKRRRK